MHYVMNMTRWLLGGSILGSAIFLGFYGVSQQAMAENEGSYGRSALPTSTVYTAECGACHMAYPANFLPKASWQLMLGQLDNHFGDNAELSQANKTIISDYLLQHAADTNGLWQNPRLMRRIEGTPLRITETAYFLRKHDEIPQRMVKGNPEVGSFSQCNACHKGAEKGLFNEHTVSVPGYGRWDD